MNAKIIILSADLNIKHFLVEALSKHGFITDAAVGTLFDVEKAIDKKLINVLILDTDTITEPPDHLRQLTNQEGFFVVLLGVKNAAPYALCGAKGALNKPESTDAFARKLFLRNIIDRIELFVRIYLPICPLGAQNAASINDTVVAIAASTGGTEALHTVLSGLPINVPPILIVQHMPSVFTHQFARRLDGVCKFSVKEAAVNDYARANQALIAPGDFHMKVVRQKNSLLVECFRGSKLHGVRPAADILFESMAEIMGKNVIGVVLTGMGVDGARGLYKLKRKGAKIIAQDEATSVVYGMPKAAVDLGIVDFQLPIDRIAGKITELL